MSTIGLFYGSSTGATTRAALSIQASIQRQIGWETELLNVAEYYLEEMQDFQHLILGIPTWNYGQLQADWEVVFDELDTLDLTGKRVAAFGLGDQQGYPDTFGDALFFLADKARSRGARLVGRWSIQGYDFRQSWAVEEGAFLGLMLDDDNQRDLTPSRVEAWVAIVAKEFTSA